MGFYYLHTETKNLIWKKFESEHDSPFVKAVWKYDIDDREDAWKIVLEGLALGASLDRVKELCKKWECDLNDFEEMLLMVHPTKLMKEGATIFLENILDLKVDEYWDKLAERKENYGTSS